MRIRDHITRGDYFWWALFTLAMAGKWLLPYLLSRELIEPSRNIQVIETTLSAVPYFSGGIFFIGAVFRPGVIGLEFSWKGALIGCLGILAVLGSVKLLPAPWALGKFHFLKSHCQAQSARNLAKWCRDQIDVTKDPKTEADNRQTMLFNQPGPCPELTELWDGPPNCNFHRDAVGFVWSAGFLSRHWGLLVMDDPKSRPKPTTYYLEWEPGVYFWMQR